MDYSISQLDRTENMKVVLFSRVGCHLCHEAEEMLLFHCPTASVINIDQSADFQSAYGLRVPVLLLSGMIVMEGKFREPELIECLGRAFQLPSHET
ncbi:MAG: hypothetical protein DWI25_02520 [Planctomycetota bacterium]|nr:MAG: hypothetical protein DWI25_02520 [Planctomycetota bacterium]